MFNLYNIALSNNNKIRQVDIFRGTVHQKFFKQFLN